MLQYFFDVPTIANLDSILFVRDRGQIFKNYILPLPTSNCIKNLRGHKGCNEGSFLTNN